MSMRQETLDSHIQLDKVGEDGAPLIAKGQIYGDERHSEFVDGEKVYHRQYEVVYQDDKLLLLRDVDDGQHRSDPVTQFREGIGSRWTLLESGQDDELLASLPDLAPVLAALERRREHYLEKSGQIAAHRAEAIKEALDIVSGYSPAPVEWDTIDGIGDETAANLVDAGVVSEADVRSASDEDLLTVDGIGTGTVERIRAQFPPEEKSTSSG